MSNHDDETRVKDFISGNKKKEIQANVNDVQYMYNSKCDCSAFHCQ